MDHLGYVSGVVLTDASAWVANCTQSHTLVDGTTVRYASPQYRIMLQCKDQRFAERFASSLGQVLSRDVRVFPFQRQFRGRGSLPGMQPDYLFKGFFVRVSAKALCLDLIAQNKTIEAGDWADTLAKTDDFLHAMLIGIVDADGHVRPSGAIYITQKDPRFIDALCTRLDIDHQIETTGAAGMHRVAILRNDVHIDTFKHEGGHYESLKPQRFSQRRRGKSRYV